jgi:bifunctional non-homologous end joining protein LigD
MARPIWKGFISFGLVMIPVSVYSAVSPAGDIDLDMLDSDDGSRIRFLRVNERTGKEVPYKQIVKGYKLDSGDYVVVTPEDIKRAAEGITKGIEIVDFVPAQEIDPVFFEKPYYVAPGKGGEKVYALLCKTLVESGRVGIARAVLHSRQHLAALMPDEDGTRLKLIEMRFADELRDPGDVIDGEVVAIDERGRSSFARLQRALKDESNNELVFFAFDLTFAGRHDLTGAPLAERRALLELILGTPTAGRVSDRVRISRAIDVEGKDLIEHACRLGLEGIVSKRRDAPYRSDRSGAWVKVKCGQRQEFVIVGFSPPRGSRAGIGALLLGVYEGSELAYAGKVGTGFDAELLLELRRRLEKLVVKQPAASRLPRDGTTLGATWVSPSLVCEVSFAQWTGEHRLRHAVFQGLREDKDPREVVRETAATKPSTRRRGQVEREPRSTADNADAAPSTKAKSVTRGARKRSGAAHAAKSDDATVEGVTISHPDRVIDASSGVTKLELARCYAEMSRWMLPELEGRPVSLVRCPAGIAGQHFFQRHLKKAPAGVRLVNVDADEPDEFSPVIETGAGLVALVQLNAVEFHPWGSRVQDIERPDRLIFDLDPGEGVPWKVLASAATIVRNELARLDLQTFVKTTGGKGIHVVLPVRPRATWEQAKTLAHGVSRRLAGAYGELFVTKMGAKNRVGKVFVDYLRNHRSATAAGAYCVRARPGMGVSMPIEWEEIASVRPDQFTVATAAAHLHGRKRDPWTGIAKVRQTITIAMTNEVAEKRKTPSRFT